MNMIIIKRWMNFKLILLCFMLFLTACAHKKTNFIIGLDSLATPYSTQHTNYPILKLSYYDMLPYLQEEGPIWSPFLFPVKDNVSIPLSESLIGFASPGQSFIFPPEGGSCKILQISKKMDEKESKLYSFVSANTQPEVDANELFLLLEPNSLSPYALVKLNQKGFANCYLPLSNYVISINYGSQRKEIPIAPPIQSSPIKIQFNQKGLLIIDPVQQKAVRNGDLIRIGRKFNDEQDFSFEKANLIPTEIENDLFLESNFQSQNIGVDEYLLTSFFVGKHPYSIQLNSGKYQIAIVRKNKIICISDINIKENSSQNLACTRARNTDIEDRILNSDELRIYFDGTVYPEHLNHNLDFQSWMLQNKNYYMPIPTSPINITQQTKEELKNNSNKPQVFSFLFLNSNIKEKSILEFPSEFRMEINNKDNTIPILATGFDNIVQGMIPFTFYNSIYFQSVIKPQRILDQSYFRSSNGVEMKLLEPLLNENGQLTSMSSQVFRIRLTVPAWNSTNILEMSLNGKLYKRWILNRGDISSPFTTTLSASSNEENSFIVHFTSWGEDPLPDFIYGTDGIIPFGKSKDYLINITGK